MGSFAFHERGAPQCIGSVKGGGALVQDTNHEETHMESLFFFNFYWSTVDLQCYVSFSVQFSSVTQSCLALCNPMDCSTPGFPVHHQLPGLAQTHVH